MQTAGSVREFKRTAACSFAGDESVPQVRPQSGLLEPAARPSQGWLAGIGTGTLVQLVNRLSPSQSAAFEKR